MATFLAYTLANSTFPKFMEGDKISNIIDNDEKINQFLEGSNANKTILALRTLLLVKYMLLIAQIAAHQGQTHRDLFSKSSQFDNIQKHGNTPIKLPITFRRFQDDS